MHNFLSKIRYSSAKIVIIVLALFSIITLLALAYNHHRINSNYRKQLTINAQETINTIDELFSGLRSTMNAFMVDAQETSCNTLEYDLKQFVESQNLVRSITIIHNNKIYCSSFFEPNQINAGILDKHTKSEINLLQSRFLKQQIPIVTYYTQQKNWSVYVAMPAFRLIEILSSKNLGKHSYIIFNDDWLNYNQQIVSNKPQLNEQWLVLKSDQYPFKIAIDFSSIAWSEKTIFSFIIIGGVLFVSLALVLLYILLTIPKRNLLKAILNREFVPYYQLIISAADQNWRGVEVLARWQHPKKGLVMPSQFIESIERYNLSTSLTKILMTKVAKELSANINQLPNPFYIGFNIHGSHLKRHDLIDDCKKFLAAFPANRVKLTLELMEGQFIDSSENLNKLLKELQKSGISIAIDDFGTGYSNFGYLQKYPIDHLKIDKLFVSKICDNTSDTKLLDGIINLGKKLNMNIVAEGVETKDQLHHLTRQGVEFIQGFLFSRPSPLHEMMALISNPISKIKLPTPYPPYTDPKTVKII